MLLPISASRALVGFSSNPAICPLPSKRKIPIWVASSGVTGCAAIVMSAPPSMCESIISLKSMRYR
jgi:hypothetical protein